MPERRHSSLSLAGSALLALLVIALPVWHGGVGATALLAAAIVAPVSLLLMAPRGEGLPWPALALALVAALIGLQAVPVPVSLHAISPAARAVFQSALEPIGQYPQARPLSLDPVATTREAGLACACLAAFVAAWTVGTGRRSRSLVVFGLVAAGLLVPLLILGRALLGLSALFPPTSPFVNPNHLAGFSNLAAFFLLGLALREHGAARLAGLSAFAVAALPVFLSLSRGGLASFLAGAGLFGLLVRRRSTQERRGLGSTLAVTLAVVLALAGWVAARPFLARMETRSLVSSEEKVALWPVGLAMVRDYPWTGVGRGAFEVAFPAFKAEQAQATFTHLENEWLQSIIDLGVPGGLLLVATIGLIWAAAARREPMSFGDAGLLAGAGAVALQNVVDFSLRIPGVAIPFMVALGLAARGGLRLVAPRWVVGAAAAVLLACGVGASTLAWGNLAADDGAAMAAAANADRTVALAREAARRHPADFLPHALAGVRLVQEGRCAEAMPWLNRAMLLNPTGPEPHLHVARCLAADGQRALARREYRLAAAYGSTEAVPEAMKRFPSLEDLLEVAPGTPEGLMTLGNLLAPTRPADAATVYRRAIEEFQDQRPAAQLAYQLLRAEQPDEALTVARARAKEEPRDVLAWEVAARAFIALDQQEQAELEAKRGLASNPGAPSLLAILGERAIQVHRYSEARRLADEMIVRTPREAYQRHMLMARAFSGQDKPRDALEQARSALAALPDSWPAMSAVAHFAEQVGRYDEAVEVLERAKRLTGQVPGDLDARIQALLEAQVLREARRASQREAP